MNALRTNKLFRLIAAFVALAVLVAAVPSPAQAAALPTFNIVSVKVDESVTIHTYNFPANMLFNVRMDVVGKAGVDGIIVTQTNTGAGGSFEETYKIPAELKGKAQIAIRLESTTGGYYTYNWFNNKSTGSIPGTGTTGNTGTTFSPKGPYIRIAGVVSNKTVTLDAYNLPTYTNFAVRVGPFYNFWKGSEIVATINTGANSNFRFTVNLPSSTRDVSWVSVRIDAAGGWYAYNAFKNVDAAVITPGSDGGNIPVTSGGSCQITSYSPSSSILKSSEFDAKWTIKNTGSTKWDMNSVDYKFLSGTSMHKYYSTYDLPKTVKPGESITIVVDMTAPKYTGWYSLSWGLVQGSTTLCSLPLTVNIK